MKRDYEEAINRVRIANPNYRKGWFVRTLQFMERMPNHLCVLDVGCGAAELAELLRDNGDHSVTCVDIALNSVQNAISKGFEAHQADLGQEQLPFESEHFDVVTLLDVIEHIFDTDHLLFEINRVLRDDGYLIVSTPSIACWPYRVHALKGNIPWKEGHHVRFFNPWLLGLYLFMNGFDIVEAAHLPVAVGRRHAIRWAVHKGMKLATQLGNDAKWQDRDETLFAQELVYLCRKNPETPPVGVSEHWWPRHVDKPPEHKLRVRQRTEQAFAVGLIAEDILKRILVHLEE